MSQFTNYFRRNLWLFLDMLFICPGRRMLRKMMFTLATFIFIYNGNSQQKERILHQLNDLLISTVMDDLFTPPITSRIYVYPNIAFYECIRFDDQSMQPLSGKLKGLKKLPSPGKGNNNFISARLSVKINSR